MKQMNTLQQRQRDYENLYDNRIISKIPVIVKIDGRSFSKVTKDVQKPFCHKTIALMTETMLALARQIEGVVFGYHYSDKIILVIKNDNGIDTTPIFNNDIQKISSVVSSMCTYEFVNALMSMNDAPNLSGSILFSAKTFAVPTVTEALNYLIYRQFCCFKYSINQAVHSLLFPQYGKEVNSILESKSIDDRRKILNDAGIDFEKFPNAYKKGTAVYAIPKISTPNHVQQKKWIIDFNIPLFSSSNEMLKTILTTGSDIFRPERDI